MSILAATGWILFLCTWWMLIRILRTLRVYTKGVDKLEEIMTRPKKRAAYYPAEWPRNLERLLAGAPLIPREIDESIMVDIGTTEPPDGFVLNHKDDMGPGRWQ